MKKFISTLVFGASLLALTGCNDFLDKTPPSNITPPAFFNTADDLAAYTINQYGFTSIAPGAYGMGPFANDNHTDNQAAMSYSTFWVPGEWQVGGGNLGFGSHRAINYFFDQVLPKYEAGQISGNETYVKHYIGEAYVLRAYVWFNSLQSYGDFPIFETALPDDKAVLLEASKRQPRNMVARFILSDLDKAIGLLMENSTPAGNKNRITRDVAYLLRSRVALYEGTWLKHHAGTAFVPGGPGWPGDAADVNYPAGDVNAESKWFLEEAMKSARVVADKHMGGLTNNTDTREGQDASLNVLNPYFMMFCDTDMEGYDEVLMWRRYNKGLGIYHNILMQLGRNGGGTGWTRGLVNSFLMRNGLPIYAANSGYDTNWEKEGVTATLQDRDSRIQIFTKRDGDVDFYLNGNPTYSSMHWLIDGATETKIVTGFALKKGKHYNGAYGGNGEHYVGVTGYCCFRAAEALLNYMEACYEATGSVDADAARYWKALRSRAKVDEDYTKTVAATNMTEEAKWDFGAYSHGQLVDKTLYNIRRERRNELIGEAMRMADLKRWRALDQMEAKPYVIEGIRFWGSKYDIDGILGDNGQDKVEVIVDPAGGTGNMSPSASEGGSDYVQPYKISQLNNTVYKRGGYTFVPAHYLSPIPHGAFTAASPDMTVENSVLYQNPGWGTETGSKPEGSEKFAN